MTKKMEKTKQLLHTDKIGHDKLKLQYDTYFTLMDELLDNVKTVMGYDHKVNYIELLENPANYLINNYWDSYQSHKPHHLKINAPQILELETGINLKDVREISTKMLMAIPRADQRPVIEKDLIKTKIDPEMFRHYLREDKARIYKKVQAFTQLANDIAKEYNWATINLLQRGFRSVIEFENGKAKPLNTSFI